MTSTFQVLCLSKKIIVGNSYMTEDYSLYNIKHDEQGRGLAIEKRFIQYTLHVVSQENIYYAIQLSTSDMASFDGKLCSLGHMEIKPGNYIDDKAHIAKYSGSKAEGIRENSREHSSSEFTHIPARILTFCANFDELHDNYDKDIGKIYLQDDPNTFLFAFSSDGGDERIPDGYAYVNMKLFHPISSYYT